MAAGRGTASGVRPRVAGGAGGKGGADVAGRFADPRDPRNNTFQKGGGGPDNGKGGGKGGGDRVQRRGRCIGRGSWEPNGADKSDGWIFFRNRIPGLSGVSAE